jgi:xylulokinase
MDGTGTVVASASVEYPLYTPRNGWAEQDPDDWRRAAGAASRQALAGVDASKVAAVGLTGQMHSSVFLDADGNPLCRAMLWCDQRTAEECADIRSAVGGARLIELTANPALTGFTAPKILWLRKNMPDVYAKVRKVLLPKDYIRYRLTGEFATDVSDAGGTGLFNVAKRAWEPEVFEKLGIPAGWLAKVYESPEVTGVVSDAAAELTGIPAGTPVVAGAGDNAAAAVGTGVARDGRAFVTVGTSGVVFAHTSRMILDPAGRAHTFCSAVPGEWHVMGVTLAAGLSLQWFRRNFAPGLSYARLDELAAASPVGANRLLFAPYLNGERAPWLDPDCRGAFVGLSASHTLGDLVRAVMEGVTFSLRDCLDIMLGMGAPIDEIAAAGGGGGSAFWRGMIADVFGRAVTTAQTQDGPALGAAILAAVGSGAFASVPEACDALIARGEPVQPNGAASEEYARAHAVYRKIYPALKSIYADSRSLRRESQANHRVNPHESA